MVRTIITIASIIVAALLFLWARSLDSYVSYADLLVDLASEVIGIGITVAAIDYVFQKSEERKRFSKEARVIAFRALHRLDHAVWVWQGGFRELYLDELSTF
jgi:hypothetical protein